MSLRRPRLETELYSTHDSLTGGVILVLLLLVSNVSATHSDTCPSRVLLAAYAHNDYQNRRPLLDALESGYRGVEADLIRSGTNLVVTHDRRDIRRTRTLARLYLQPLVGLKRACGHVLSDSTAFELFIDLKEADHEALRLLVAELQSFEELFQPDSGATPPLRVTLVGWVPNADVPSWPAYLRVDLPMVRVADIRPPLDSSRIGLVSIDYGKALRWDGQGPVPQRAVDILAQARQMAEALRVPLRVHHAPAQSNIVRWLLSEGVTLIGAGNLARMRSVLLEVPKQ